MWLRLRTVADFGVNYVETLGLNTKPLASYQLNANCEMRNNFLLRVSLHQNTIKVGGNVLNVQCNCLRPLDKKICS